MNTSECRIVPHTIAHEARLPAQIVLWTETDLYETGWVVIGTANTANGLCSLIGRALKRANREWGKREDQRPFLTTKGPRMGTVGVQELP